MELLPVPDLPEVSPGDDLAGMIADRIPLEPGDVVTVASTVVSKAEGRTVDLADVTAGERAERIATRLEAITGDPKDPRFAQVVLDESEELLMEAPFVLTVSPFGHVGVNAGIDRSNVADHDLLLLPTDPTASAERIRTGLLSHVEWSHDRGGSDGGEGSGERGGSDGGEASGERGGSSEGRERSAVTPTRGDGGRVSPSDATTSDGSILDEDVPTDVDSRPSADDQPEDSDDHTGGVDDLAVIVTDTCGRPFRHGQRGVALGWAGMPASRDWRGEPDRDGRELGVTVQSVVDELAAAANLVAGEGAGGTPAVVVRDFAFGDLAGSDRLFRDPEDDFVRQALREWSFE